ncbi:MAG: hypothetical protein ACRDY7_12755 [Acidimicrobiia bacterium]
MRVGFVGAGLMGAPIAGDVAGGLGLGASAGPDPGPLRRGARYGDDVDYGSVARLVGW